MKLALSTLRFSPQAFRGEFLPLPTDPLVLDPFGQTMQTVLMLIDRLTTFRINAFS